MPSELIKQLLEAGVHFGHQAKRWNPKMSKYIFGERSGIYIIDLEKTAECLNKARDFIIDLTSKGNSVLFVGTKKQAKEIIQREAGRCGMYWASERWLGGLMTNFSTIKKSISRLKDIEKMKEDGTCQKLTKKEVAWLEKELFGLNKNLCGVKQMEGLPGALFIVDTKKEDTAVREANKLSIPIVALIDTNSDPDRVDYPIPGNDDAIKSIQLITSLIADSVVEGRRRFLSYLSVEGVQRQAEAAATEAAAGSARQDQTKIDEIEEDLERDKEKAEKSSKKGPKAKTDK